MTHGAAWMIGLRVADRCIGFASTIVLARLLVPADFGLIALAMVVVAAIDVLGEFGFDLVLIQNQKAERSHYDTAWTLGLLRGLISAALIALAAAPIADLYGDPRLADIIFILALLPLLEGFHNIGVVEFRKQLTFNKEFRFRILPRLSGTVVTIVLALLWRDYWALVVGTLVGAALRLILSYVMQPYRPRLSFAAWREIMNFSKWILATSVVGFVNNRADTFAVGKFLDVATLGLFSLASQIAALTTSELMAPIVRALFPGYAKLSHDQALLKKAFVDTYAILVLVAVPVACGIGVTAELFVPILLGSKWLGAIPLIELLVVFGALRVVGGHVRPIYLAMSRPQFGTYIMLIQSVVFLPLLFLGLWQFGVVGAALAHVASQSVLTIVNIWIVRRLLSLRLRDLWLASWRSFGSCILMVAAVETLISFPPFGVTGFFEQMALLLLAVALGAFVYAASVLLLWSLSGKVERSAEAHVLSYVADSLRKRRARAEPSIFLGSSDGER
ncbi:lipopolysaccharide biosynthesis protein [Pelagibius sp.]|uniref:lipopolysaccharide biosynthesis protein n=1 Tax=Pelagibius sp. TaxID=1931238 RepID=UPI002610D25F|nr:lipopolysaccharide biosynthesis protein [Pelagibius sp.]